MRLTTTAALWHCRNRSIGNSDYTRTERQREVIGIIIDKILSMSLGEVSSIVFELRNYVNTNIPMQTILELGYDAMIAGNIEVESSRVPFDGEFWSANKNGASVLELDMDANTALLHEFLGYEVNETDETTGDEETTRGEEVTGEPNTGIKNIDSKDAYSSAENDDSGDENVGGSIEFDCNNADEAVTSRANAETTDNIEVATSSSSVEIDDIEEQSNTITSDTTDNTTITDNEQPQATKELDEKEA